jgi:hypothetical protein
MVVAWISGIGGLWAYLTKTNDLFSTKTEEKIGRTASCTICKID